MRAGRRRFVVGALVSCALAGCAAAHRRSPVAPAPGAGVWVSVRVREGPSLVLVHDGWMRLGQPARVVARSTGDGPGVVLDVLVQHQAARSGAYSARLALSLGGAVLAAPVLTLLPGHPAAVDVVADGRAFHLELGLAAAPPQSAPG